jgi:hypothetical protein
MLVGAGSVPRYEQVLMVPSFVLAVRILRSTGRYTTARDVHIHRTDRMAPAPNPSPSPTAQKLKMQFPQTYNYPVRSELKLSPANININNT